MSNTRSYRCRKKMRLLMGQGGKCFYCGRAINLIGATFDHIVPKCKGGTLRLSNTCIACRSCNQAKGAMPQADYLKSIGRLA